MNESVTISGKGKVKYIENNTWVLGNTRFISSVEHDISRVSAAKNEISCSTREINLIFPSTHVFFCLLYKRQSLKSDIFYRKAKIEKR